MPGKRTAGANIPEIVYVRLHYVDPRSAVDTHVHRCNHLMTDKAHTLTHRHRLTHSHTDTGSRTHTHTHTNTHK